MQETIVVILVIAALSYLGWRFYGKLNKKTACGTDCGCEPKAASKSN